MAVALFIAGSAGNKMTVAIPCVPPPALFADCFSLSVFPSHVTDPHGGDAGASKLFMRESQPRM